MKRAVLCALALLVSRSVMAQDAAAVLDAVDAAMGTAKLASIQYSGNGSSYFVGQAPTPGGPWLHYALKAYTAEINYTAPSMRQELDRIQDDGGVPFGGAHQAWFVSGKDAWNVNGPALAATLRDPSGVKTAEQRNLEIWLSPPGFIRAAKVNRATVKTQGANKVVTFTTPDRFKVTGVINASHLVEKTETAIDNPVMGDMTISMTFADYRPFGDVKFPGRIVETIGGYPALELTVTAVKPNGAAAVGDTPAAARNLPAVVVKSENVGAGVWYLTGGSHNSLLVEFKDHLVVIEGPQDEARSSAVIAEVHKLVPGKPIRYVVNTHNHFDHLGGVRTYAAEGATIVAPMADKAYYEKALNTPHTIVPDKLATSGRKAKVEGVDGKRVLTDGTQTIELYVLKLTHADAMLFPYLPKEKMLVQADMTVAPPPNAPAPAIANLVALELYRNIEARTIDVARIAGIHGRITTWKELLAMAGK